MKSFDIGSGGYCISELVQYTLDSMDCKRRLAQIRHFQSELQVAQDYLFGALWDQVIF